MAKYIFNPAEKYPRGMIPKAIYNAQMRQPCEEIKPFWEGAIMRDLENHDMRFSWNQFLRGMIP